MTPESPETVGARAREIVARHARRRPVVVSIVSPIVRREPEPPGRYAPVRLAVSPWVTWEQTQADEAAREPWSAIGERLATMATRATPTRRMPWAERVAFDADDYVSGAR